MDSIRSNENIWALVPIKRIENAKFRLAPFLDPNERRALMQAMFRDVLATLSRVKNLGGILVVTSDRDAAAIAVRSGAVAIPDLVETGVNGAVECGVDWLRANHIAGMLVVPGDVPFITVPEIDFVLQAMKSSSVVLAPATRDGGTNILALAPPDLFRPAYGPMSFARHIAAARTAGVEPEILDLEGAGHDIDLAVDLVFDSSQNPLSWTRSCLENFSGLCTSVPAGSLKEKFAP